MSVFLKSTKSLATGLNLCTMHFRSVLVVFSSNSVSSQLGGYYYTLHITPESGWSYASFETNYPFNDSASSTTVVEVLVKVLSIFQPGRFSATLIADLSFRSAQQFKALSSCCGELSKRGYRKQDKVTYDMRGDYKLLYVNYQKR